MRASSTLALLLLLLAVAACGGVRDEGEAGGPEHEPPYSQEATGECLEEAGYELSYSHGDPPSRRAEDIVWEISVEDVGTTSIVFTHPARETSAGEEGERYGNAVVRIDERAASEEDRAAILRCLR